MLGFYSKHGVGKSSLAAAAARDLWRKHGWKTQVVSIDPGSRAAYERGEAEGYIEYFSADNWTNYAFDVLWTRLGEGAWPVDTKAPGSPLVKGILSIRLCPKCGKDTGAPPHSHVMACKSCNARFPPGTSIPETRLLAPHLVGVGLRVYEGITKVGEGLLEACRQAAPTGDKFYVGGTQEDVGMLRLANEALRLREKATQEQTAALVEVKKGEAEGRFSMALTPDQGHYFKAGKDVEKILGASQRLPIPMVIWTAHEGRWEVSTDKTNRNAPMKLMGLGPGILPAKAMQTALRDFVLFGRITVEDGKRVLYLSQHPGEGNIKWESKCNIPGMPAKVILPDLFEANGFGLLMEEMEKARARVMP
jgi:hypothetical protein